MKRFIHSMLGLAALLPLTALGQSMGGYTSCQTEYNNGYSNGVRDGAAAGRQEGIATGIGQGQQNCLLDPASCGITLASCLPAPQFGETEPNDNMVTGDALVLGSQFWGQSYGTVDQDWFYVVTTAPNQNLTLTFKVPGNDTLPAGWRVTVRDARGTVFAEFDSSVPGAIRPDTTDTNSQGSVIYSVTLGFVGTYYIVVESKSAVTDQRYATYSLSAVLQDSPLGTQNPIAGFFDTEIEPNDLPSQSVPIANGVTMYGMVNLMFEQTVEQQTDGVWEDVWGQGEDDWYVYASKGNELVTMSLCQRETCGPGDWFVQVYNQADAQRVESLIKAGQRYDGPSGVTPLLSFNTDNTQADPETFRIGLRDPGYYFIRVNHKRLFSAPCVQYRYVESDGGFLNGNEGVCSCDTENAEDKSVTGSACFIPTPTLAIAQKCADGDLLCKIVTQDCLSDINPGCIILDNNPPGCLMPYEEPPEGSTSILICGTAQTLARCSCSVFGGVVEVPEGAYTSPYNFTWYGTNLPPNTIDTDAYKDFFNRPNPYATQ